MLYRPAAMICRVLKLLQTSDLVNALVQRAAVDVRRGREDET